MSPRFLSAALAAACVVLVLASTPIHAATAALVEAEEEVYRYEPADNGAGPMWCSGSTCLVRHGDTVYATGLETIPDAKPLNNCRWVLWRRDEKGWTRVFADETGRTREPAPLVTFADGQVIVSGNPTLNPPDRGGGGPAQPEIRRVAGPGANPSTALLPRWQGTPKFSEHSYRTFVADRTAGELLLFQNIDYAHAEWAFRDAKGEWPAQGQLKWPWGADYAKPQPIRVCYPNVALVNRAVHFLGISDIIEPNPAWRAYKKELTGKEWDYEFRRLFYTSTPDITRAPFREWIEVASREKTCGWISPCDLNVAADGSVRVLWTERALDERLRAKFFPDARQRHSLEFALIRDGRVMSRRTLLESTEDHPGPVASGARFHVRPDGTLLVVRFVAGPDGRRNEAVELAADGTPGSVIAIPLTKPFTGFFTATPRAGSAPADVIDLLGVRDGTDRSIAYARIRLR